MALRLETSRVWVERLGWTGLVLGLAFTAANVQHFAAQGAEPWSLVWVTAWLLDPMVSLVLLAILLGESMTSRHQLPTDGWVRATKWAALGATYAMNTWHAWATVNLASILLHSVPPALVFFAAEALPQLRYRMTEAIGRAYASAVTATTGAASGEPFTATPRAEREQSAERFTGFPASAWVDAGDRPTLPVVARQVTERRSNGDQAQRRPAAKRADAGRRVPPAARKAEVKARTVAELARRLDELIAAGDLTEDASNNKTRLALECSPQRAKEAAEYRRTHLHRTDPARLAMVEPDAEQEAA
ncbi:hypothetical protein [Allonocardiopsis opalescens]|uniref:hypothetical protein n=1 Tax=Allonocardiopsis opalescens TaxID=1144618 RepID=UPI0011B1DA3D|nr:hypothetical protein [Allonocardiopsis opalescens]